MRAAFVLPDAALTNEAILRTLAGLRYRFPTLNEFALVCPATMTEYYRQLFPTVEITTVTGDREVASAPPVSQASAVVFLCGPEGRHFCSPTVVQKPGGPRVYITDYTGIVLTADGSIDEVEYPYLTSHVFMRDGAAMPNGRFCYFPYGYLFRYAGLGPLNEFGHRISRPLREVQERGTDTKLIVVFGGSAAWGMYALHHEMFSQVLEDRLNTFLQEQGAPERFLVLNFAQHGNVLLNHLVTYTLFCVSLRPEIVISHDGFNDMAYGQTSDSLLLNDHAITYQSNIEFWGAQLQMPNPPPTPDPTRLPIRNLPMGIIGAYEERLLQFQQTAQRVTNSVFINGLQPAVFHKGKTSPLEDVYLKTHHAGKFDIEFVHNLPFLYEQYLGKDPGSRLQHFVNFPDVFRSYGEDVTLFGDIMHTLPAGERVIAGTYFDLIRTRILPVLCGE